MGGAWEGADEGAAAGCPVGAGPKMGLGMASGSLRFRSPALWSAICFTCAPARPRHNTRLASMRDQALVTAWHRFMSPEGSCASALSGLEVTSSPAHLLDCAAFPAGAATPHSDCKGACCRSDTVERNRQ